MAETKTPPVGNEEKKPEIKKATLTVGENAVIVDRVSPDGVHLAVNPLNIDMSGQFFPTHYWEQCTSVKGRDVLSDTTFAVRIEATRKVESQLVVAKNAELEKAIAKMDNDKVESLIVEIGKLKQTPAPDYLVEFDIKKGREKLQEWKKWQQSRADIPLNT